MGQVMKSEEVTKPIQRQQSNEDGTKPTQCSDVLQWKTAKDEQNYRIKIHLNVPEPGDALNAVSVPFGGDNKYKDDLLPGHWYKLSCLKVIGGSILGQSEKLKSFKELEPADIRQDAEKSAEDITEDLASSKDVDELVQDGCRNPDVSDESEEDTKGDLQIRLEKAEDNRNDNQKEDEQQEKCQKEEMEKEFSKENHEDGTVDTESESDEEPKGSQTEMTEVVVEQQAGQPEAQETLSHGQRAQPSKKTNKLLAGQKKTSLRELVDLTKAEESLLRKASYKVRSAANETSDGKTSGCSGQNGADRTKMDGSSRKSPAAGGRRRNANGKDDDGDGDGTSRRKVEEKRLGCDRPTQEKKGHSKKEGKPGERTPSPTQGVQQLPLWARQKEPGPSPAVCGPPGVQKTRLHPDINSLNQEMAEMSLRDASSSEQQKHSLDQETQRMSEAFGKLFQGGNIQASPEMAAGGFSSYPLKRHAELSGGPRKVLRSNLHIDCSSADNVKAFKSLFEDDGIKASHEVPACSARPPAGPSGDSPARHSAELPSSKRSSSPEPMDDSPDIMSQVVHGTSKHLVALAKQVQKQKHLAYEQHQGQHQGVLLDEQLTVVSGMYQDGHQYHKQHFLGKGSYGDVYLLQDKKSKKTIVGKQVVIRPENHENFLAREVETLCGLEHPNIVALLGLVRTDEAVLLIFSYLEGCKDMQKLIKENGVLGQGLALHLGEQIFYALVYLHGQKIVHKDIKPENTLVSSNYRVKLIDFGLAMRMTTNVHQPDDKLEGTECYMAPEIAGSREYDQRVDIWSAFCTLICAISGQPPWAERYRGVRVKIYIITTSEPPLDDIPCDADPRLKKFIALGLKKSFRERPTAAQVLESYPRELVDELFDKKAIGSSEPEVEPMLEADILPDANAGPLTPRTPRAPQDVDFNLQPGGGAAGRLGLEMMSLKGIPGLLEDDSGDESSLELAASIGRDFASRRLSTSSSSGVKVEDDDAAVEVEEEEEEEDMYGPSMDVDGEGGACSVADGGSQNSHAKWSFMQDREGGGDRPAPLQGQAMDAECHIDESFELPVQGGSLQAPGTSSFEVPNGAAAGTSGFDSNSPGHSAEEDKRPDLALEKHSSRDIHQGADLTALEDSEPFTEEQFL